MKITLTNFERSFITKEARKYQERTDDEYSIRFVLLEIEHRWHNQLEQIVKEVFEEKLKRHKEEKARYSLEPNSK